MRIEAVTVCVDYADFLAETLPHLLPQVDDLIVVTSPEDGRTKRLCFQHGVRCLTTRAFYRDGERFNKARGINYGLMHLKTDDWILHVDADIVLPPGTRSMLAKTCLDRSKIYGIDRVDCVGRRSWDEFRASPELQYEWSCLVRPPRQWPLGARIAHMDHGGYCPIGFFQLWHAASGITRYPMRQGSAEHTDVLHSLQWEREERALIPELFAIHLATRCETANVPMGENWQGRRTPEFTLQEGAYGTSGKPERDGLEPGKQTHRTHPSKTYF